MISGKKKDYREKEGNSFTINGIDFDINIQEFKDFLIHSSTFMDITKEGFDTMIGNISDIILDNENQSSMLEELRPQLKFLREINLYLKSIYCNNNLDYPVPLSEANQSVVFTKRSLYFSKISRYLFFQYSVSDGC